MATCHDANNTFWSQSLYHLPPEVWEIFNTQPSRWMYYSLIHASIQPLPLIQGWVAGATAQARMQRPSSHHLTMLWLQVTAEIHSYIKQIKFMTSRVIFCTPSAILYWPFFNKVTCIISCSLFSTDRCLAVAVHVHGTPVLLSDWNVSGSEDGRTRLTRVLNVFFQLYSNFTIFLGQYTNWGLLSIHSGTQVHFQACHTKTNTGSVLVAKPVEEFGSLTVEWCVFAPFLISYFFVCLPNLTVSDQHFKWRCLLVNNWLGHR